MKKNNIMLGLVEFLKQIEKKIRDSIVMYRGVKRIKFKKELKIR